MKRFSVIALAVAAVMLFAIPAMAVDLDFSGQYRARGYFNDNTDLNDNTGASNAWMDQRFRLQTVFKVHDNLSVTTRLDAIDNQKWGQDSGSAEHNLFSTDADALRFDRAYLTAKFDDLFDLHVGRMAGGQFGTKFADYVYAGDRIKLMKSVDQWTFGLVYQKAAEFDSGEVNTPNNDQADQDRDMYYALGIYKQEGLNAGLLYGYEVDKRATEQDYVGVGVSTYSTKVHCFNPYVVADIGPAKLEAELFWRTGDWRDYDDATPDIDLDAKTFMIQAGMPVGPVGLDVGYAHADGDDNLSDTDQEGYLWMGGRDWQPLLILTGFYSDSNLGGLGNLNMANNTSINNIGFDIFYLTAAFTPTEKITLNAIVASATADETAQLGTNVDDDIGWEFDLGATVKLMDNLTYNATIGFLTAGDLWKQGVASATVDDTWSMLHCINLTF